MSCSRLSIVASVAKARLWTVLAWLSVPVQHMVLVADTPQSCLQVKHVPFQLLNALLANLELLLGVCCCKQALQLIVG